MNLLTPKRADKAKEIAQAAQSHFAMKGFAAASMEKIAAGAGIGKSTIYEYYENKEELFIAAVLEACDLWMNEIEAITQQTRDPIERLERIALEFMSCDDNQPMASQRFYFEMLMQTIMKGGVLNERHHLTEPIHQKFIRTIADILLAGVSRGQLKPGIARDAEKIAITYLAFIDGMALNALCPSTYIDVTGQVKFFMHHLACLLRIENQAPEQPLIQTTTAD